MIKNLDQIIKAKSFGDVEELTSPNKVQEKI